MKKKSKLDHAVVRKSVQVNAPQTHAFKVFTEHVGSWWPLSTHHIGTDPAQTAIIERREGVGLNVPAMVWSVIGDVC